MKILFTGGGTLGPVIPLLAVAEEIKNQAPNSDLFWIGTKTGPEKTIVKSYNIEFRNIYSGKLRRYFSLQNFFDIFKIIIGFVESIFILIKIKPKVIVSAGGFVAVPVIWAGWFLGIKIFVHQQDVLVGLANKVCFPLASKITFCFRKSMPAKPSQKMSLIGNPIRSKLKNVKQQTKEELIAKYGLKQNTPTILITSGGRGSVAVNDFIFSISDELSKHAQIIHITGKDKFIKPKQTPSNYHIYDFVKDTTEVLQLADLIIARAGLGTLTEIAYLKKPSIIIPIPHSHQELNAKYFAEQNAIKLINQEELDTKNFLKLVSNLLSKPRNASTLGQNAYNAMSWQAEVKLAKMILKA